MEKYTWNDVTIKQFEEILAISEMKISDTDKFIGFLSTMTGMDEDHYLDMPLPQFKQEVDKISFIFHSLPDKRFDCTRKYQLLGEEYNFTVSAEKMSAGQFIDYQNTLANTPNDIAMLVSILLIPKSKKYGEGYDPIELRAVIHEHFKYVDAMGVSFFFQQVSAALQRSSLRYSLRKLKKARKKERDQQNIKAIEEGITAIKTLMYGSAS